MRVTPQVALVYTPLVLLFNNNLGKTELQNIKCCYRLLLLLTSVKHPPGILLSMSDFKILH